MSSKGRGGVGTRIREARLGVIPAPMKQTDLAHRLGVSQARLSNWERGDHDPPLEYVLGAARALGVSVDWLMGEDVPMRESRHSVQVYRGGNRFIPVKGAIAAGMPACSEADIDWIEIRDWGGDLERWGRVIDGFSMTSDEAATDDLQPGDIAVFEDRRAEFGHIVHAFSDGRDTVKALRNVHGDVELWPINPRYEPLDAEGWRVKGVVVMRIRRREQGIVETVEFPHGMRHRFKG